MTELTKMENLTGRLDRLLSELMIASKELATFDKADLQTLKHHAEDMEAAAKVVLHRLKVAGVLKIVDANLDSQGRETFATELIQKPVIYNPGSFPTAQEEKDYQDLRAMGP